MMDSAKEKSKSDCSLVWEGSNPQTNTPSNNLKLNWKVLDVRSDMEAKRILAEKGLGHLLQAILTHDKARANGEFATLENTEMA